jgi:hypothetical protein
MRKDDSRLAGILGAIILHLIAAIIFMLVRIGSLDIKEYTREYQIALEEHVETVNKESMDYKGPGSLEQILGDDQEMLNIARNLARQPDVKIDREDYIDRVKEEMIRDGKLGEENYIDDWKRLKETTSDGNLILEKKPVEKERTDNKDDSREMASKYSGPTRIYYSLEGRTHTYLPLPIYRCEGAGKVVLSIEVNSKGIVTSATIIISESTTGDPCLLDTAVKTALISLFNADIKSQKSQSGTLTYLFVAQ